MVKRFLALMVMAVLVTGCGTTAAFERRLQSAVGKDVDSVVALWGPPVGYWKTDNRETLVWTWSNQGSFQVTSPTSTYTQGMVGRTPYSGWSYGTKTTSTPYNFWCKWTLYAIEGRVTRWAYDGNRCVADDD